MLKTYKFRLEIGGVRLGMFSEITGLDSEIEVESFTEGGKNNGMHYFPTAVRHPRLVLKRGIVDYEMYSWFAEVVRSIRFRETAAPARKPITVSVPDDDGNEAVRWDFVDCLPVKWTGPSLNTSSSSVAVETIEFVYDDVRFTKTPGAFRA